MCKHININISHIIPNCWSLLRFRLFQWPPAKFCCQVLIIYIEHTLPFSLPLSFALSQTTQQIDNQIVQISGKLHKHKLYNILHQVASSAEISTKCWPQKANLAAHRHKRRAHRLQNESSQLWRAAGDKVGNWTKVPHALHWYKAKNKKCSTQKYLMC